MKISNLGLQAFTQTALRLNFTQAADDLGLTQSALSQRIALLEKELEVILFIREPRNLKLTPAGERLLRFASLNASLEAELLLEFQGQKSELAGEIRLAAYSSILRSIVIPALAPFLRKHPRIHIDFQTYEMFELPHILQTQRADLVIMDYRWGKRGISELELGTEEFVAIESSKWDAPHDLYLDHGPLDNATEEFFKNQSRQPKTIRRSFMGDVYGIIDGVELGLGRAIMSRHLIENNRHIRIIPGYKKYSRPVTVHYFEQPYHSILMGKVIAELKEQTAKFFL